MKPIWKTIYKVTKTFLKDTEVVAAAEEIKQVLLVRMDKYRIYYILALVLGVLSVVFIFLKISWISITCAIIGFVIVNITSFKRNRWKRIYENLLYLKKERQKKKNEMDKGKNKDKYRRSGINK